MHSYVRTTNNIFWFIFYRAFLCIAVNFCYASQGTILVVLEYEPGTGVLSNKIQAQDYPGVLE